MANLSQEKRQRMLAFLETIREEHKDDDEVLIALGEIESELNAKKYGLVWERHEEAVDVQMRDADYIIMKKDGTVWIIETKGGETKGKDKNIDIQIENKFNAFKNYAAEHSLHWGFVRDKDNQLYINNTEFAHDMSDDHWVPLSQEF